MVSSPAMPLGTRPGALSLTSVIDAFLEMLRQGHPKQRAPARGVFDQDGPAHCFHELTDHPQSHPEAAALLAAPHCALEALKHPRPILFGDAATVVADGDADLSSSPFSGQLDRRVGTVLERI